MLFASKKPGKKKLKKLKAKEKEAALRRMHIIIEARAKHEKNRKTASKSLARGGFTSVSTMEEDDLGMKIASGIETTLNISGKALAKFKSRQKSLNKSRSTHLAKLQTARSKMASRSRA